MAPNEDPVCAMAVDLAAAAANGLLLVDEHRVYAFCSTGCLLQFRADPAWFLDPAYTPMMTVAPAVDRLADTRQGY